MQLGYQQAEAFALLVQTPSPVLSPANQNLIASAHREGSFALLSHGWVLFFMSIALIQSHLPAKLHKKNKRCTTDTAASHPHFTAPLGTNTPLAQAPLPTQCFLSPPFVPRALHPTQMPLEQLHQLPQTLLHELVLLLSAVGITSLLALTHNFLAAR